MRDLQITDSDNFQPTAHLLQPFRIACPNCASRLVVRHAHLVGQTLPCPQCKQPLLVNVPSDPLFPAPVPDSIPNLRVPHSPAVNSEAITQADPEQWKDQPLGTAPFQPSPPQEREATSRETSSPISSAPVRDALPTPSQRTPQTWESSSAVARRNMLLVTAIAASGLLLAGLAFVAFIRSYGRSNDRLANNPVTVNENAPAEKETAETNQEIVPDQRPDQVDPLPNPNPNPNETNESQAKDEVDTPPPASPDPTSSNDPVKDLLDPSAASPLFPPGETDPPPAPANAPDAPPANAGLEDKLPSVFEDFQRWIDAPSRGKWDDIGKSDRKIEGEISLENTEIIFREEYYPNAIPIPAWQERSQRSISKVKTQPMPLLRCIDWFSKITNAGISADWLELNLAGVDFQESIVLEGENLTVGELLDQLCSERQLALVVDPSGFPRIRPSEERLASLIGPNGILNTDQAVNDLPLERRDAWVPLLMRLLDLSQCDYNQGRLTWTAEARLYDRARFLGTLRALQDATAETPVEFKPPKDAFDFVRPQSWWMLREQVQKKMPMDRIVHEERPVIDLLAQASSYSGTQLVIDWPAVWSHGLHPSRISLSIMRGRSLEEIANRYLEDYSLELVALDSKTVMLTTDSVRRSIEQVVPVRLDRGMNIDDIKAAIRSLVPRGPDQKSRFRWEPVPGNDQVALLRICLPALTHLRDSELQKAFGYQSPNTNTDRE